LTWHYKNAFFNYFTTINPNPVTTQKPKIDRAELLEVAKCYANGGLEPAMAVKGAIELLNEVNKACNDTN